MTGPADHDWDCPVCGKTHHANSGPRSPQRPCHSHKTGTGEPCTKRALIGQTVCENHGGGPKKAREAGLRRRAEEKARMDLERYLTRMGMIEADGPVEDVDPGLVLLQALSYTWAEAKWIRARVYQLEPEALTWGRTKYATGGQMKGETFESGVMVWLKMYWERSDRAAEMAAKAVQLGLKEREVKLAEQLADQLAAAIDGILIDLGHDPKDPDTASKVTRHLRAVS